MPHPRFHPFVRLILCAVAVVVSVFAFSALALVLMSVGSQAVTTTNTPTMGFNLTPRMMMALMSVQPPAVILAVWLCRKALDARSLASLGVHRRNGGQFFSGALCGLLAIAFLFGLLWVSGQVQVLGFSQRAQEIGAGGIAGQLFLWAALMLGVGLSEEILFRGYVMHNLGVWLGADKIGLGAAAIIQALLFGLVHLGNFADAPTPEKMSAAWQAVPNIVLIGVFFALCAFKTGSLWFPIGFHAAWNFFLGSVFSLPVSGLDTFRLLETEVSGSRWLTGGAFGAEGSVLLTIITLVLIFMVRRAPDHSQVIGDIASLHPQHEPDDVEVGSRAPSLRERKEKRRVQTTTATTFEGWNDLAPAQRQRYSTYQPTQPPSSEEAPLPQSASSQIPTENTSVINAPPVNAPAEQAPIQKRESPDFAQLVPPLPVEPGPAPVIEAAVDISTAPIESTPIAASEPATPAAAPTVPAAPSAPTPPTAPSASPTAPQSPPASPPAKKPPAPRW